MFEWRFHKIRAIRVIRVQSLLHTALLQQPSAMIVLQHSHLLYGYLVKPYELLALGQSLFDEHGVEVFHVRQADLLVDSCVVTNH